MSLFQDMDLASAADDPFGIPADTYDAVISDIIIKEPKQVTDDKGAAPFFILEYTIEGGDYDSKTQQEWKRMPSTDSNDPGYRLSAEGKQRASFIKSRLLSLGIPESRVDTVGRDDLIGIKVRITIKKNGDYTNIPQNGVELREPPQVGFSEEGAAVFTGPANPFSS